MRNDKVWLAHSPVSETNDIQVQGSGAPTLAALPSLLPLDGLQSLEQLSRFQAGFQQHHLIEVGRLALAPERRGFFYPRSGKQPGVRQGGECRAGSVQVSFAVAQVAAERDVDRFGL